MTLCEGEGPLSPVVVELTLTALFPTPPVALTAALWADVVPVEIDATLQADLLPLSSPALGWAGTLVTDSSVVLSATLPLLSLPLGWSSNLSVTVELVEDIIGPRVRSRATQAATTANATRVPHTDMRRAEKSCQTPNQPAERCASSGAFSQASMSSVCRFAELLTTEGIRLTGRTDTPQTETQRHLRTARLIAADTRLIQASARLSHAERIYTRTWRRTEQTEGLPRVQTQRIGHRQAHPTHARLHPPYTDMMWPLPGRWWPRYDAPRLIVQLCCLTQPATLGAAIVLTPGYPRWPGCGALSEPEPGTLVIPVRRIYRVINTVTLTRVSDEAAIPADGLSLSLDAESWTWSWSARVPGSALAQLQVNGVPAELRATVNGQSIRLLIDSISRSREFGSSWLAVRGRGRAAVLAAPTAPSVSRYNTETRTAQQLLADALTENGVEIGWDVDWELEDWSVPAGAWSHTGSYIEAATRIAEAGGGYVQAHDLLPTLRLLPYYPVKPWDWAETAPDIDLPEDVCHTEGMEWVEKAGYNAVWITGARRDYVRRANTNGLTMAPTVVDDLATDAVMTRQRGVRIFADTGRQALITVKLPVIPETGIIHPGQLIRYTEHGTARLGLSRAVSVECGFPEVWQTIRLEAREP